MKLAERFDEPPELVALVNQILQAKPPQAWQRDALRVAQSAKFYVVFVKTKMHEYGGTCAKVEASERFKTGYEFKVKIWRDEFDTITNDGKLRLLVHELAHMARKEDDEPSLRDHGITKYGDYCEIPTHDKFSASIVSDIRDQINVPVFPEKKTDTDKPKFVIIDGVRVYA